MYVHKDHIRSWVVHTFNLKRLDRENMGGSTKALKRSFSQMITANKDESNLEEKQEINPKRSKTASDEDDCDEATCSSQKRISKPAKLFDDAEKNEISSVNPKDR